MSLFRRRGPRVEIWRGRDGRWYFHRKAANGNTSDVSTGYSRVDSARRGAQRAHPGVPQVVLD